MLRLLPPLLFIIILFHLIKMTKLLYVAINICFEVLFLINCCYDNVNYKMIQVLFLLPPLLAAERELPWPKRVKSERV